MYFQIDFQKVTFDQIRKNCAALEVANHFTSLDSDFERDKRERSDVEMDNHDYDNKSIPSTEEDKDMSTSLFQWLKKVERVNMVTK